MKEKVNIEWEGGRTTNAMQFGTCDFQITNEKVTQNTNYRSLLNKYEK